MGIPVLAAFTIYLPYGAVGTGTWKGYTLSWLLIVIAIAICYFFLEHLKVCPGEEKIAHYADDRLLFLVNTNYSLSNAISLITEFDDYSGLCMNWSKSVLFPINALPPSIRALH